jgi:tripartite-type tricarboxylate transporter receptor subunit TctC
MKTNTMISRVAVVFFVLLASAAQALEQAYPTRQIIIINPWPPGGPTDLVARPLADYLTKALGQTVVMENRPGANGMIGSNGVARAQPDGYTLLFSHVGPMAISPAVTAHMLYDPGKDFTPISVVASGQLLLVVRPGLNIKSLDDLIAYARANPGKLKYGTVGPGSTTHLAVEWLKTLAKIDMIHIPYKGSTPAITDMLGGTIDLGFLNLAGLIGFVQANQLVPIAVSTPERSALFPDIPAVSEKYPGFNVASWYGIEAPAKTPQSIIDRIHKEVTIFVEKPEIKKLFADNGLVAGGNSPEEHAKQIKDEIVLWESLARTAGVAKE